MKIITLHCDYIKFKALKKAISKAEELKIKSEISVKEPLVVLIAVEIGDSHKEVKELVEAIKKIAADVKAKNIVLYPYAHLSSKLAPPDAALEYIVETEQILSKEGYKITRAPFGYYKEFELKVKGHPLSELSKEFGAERLAISPKVMIQKGEAERDSDPSKLLRELSRSKLDTSKLKENDHRILGQNLDLFSFNEASPGSIFWHHNGLIIYNELTKFSREIQQKAGYLEVSTPQILDSKLWKVSGHWQHYKDSMFIADYEGREFAVKPMNCPGAMLIYKAKSRSYKELPLRLSEYGIVHRKELSGVLAGLFRLIKFTQDDAHIFCTFEQLESEIVELIKLIKLVYKDTFDFDYSLALSTRPDKFMGKMEDWSKAEKVLETVLKKSKIKYKINKGEGAFYGPKIDIVVKDSLKREWQLATIQLDMQLPRRFEISYTSKENKEGMPIVIHRAIMGSLERFIGVLLEHLNGNLPIWLSPTQVRIISFTDRNVNTSKKLVERLKKAGIRADLDDKNTPIQGKIREASLLKIPFIITIGDKEEKTTTISVRARDGKIRYNLKAEDFEKELAEKIKTRAFS